MSRLYKFLLFCLCLIFSANLAAQTITVTGKIVSEEDGLGLPNVTIQIKGSTNGTVSDIDGNYNIQVESDGTLIFSFVGFDPQEVPVNGRSSIDVTMKVSSEMLEGVVVTALGIKRQKRELGYSTEELSGELIAKSGTGNVISALSGRSAGVQIINPTGVEGSSSRIVIRGNNSIFGNNQPLIVVDGVPMSNENGLSDGLGGDWSYQDWGSALNNINQEDIESLDILKGPTAAALYGSRGGNGVVLITTKKGSKQKGLGVSYSVSYKLTTPYMYRDVQNIYGAGGPISFNEPTLKPNADGILDYNESCKYSVDDGPEGISTNTTFGYYGGAVSWGPKMDGTEILWWDGVMRPFSPQPDNLSMLYKNSYMLTNNVSFQNAGDFGSIRVSFTDSRSDAIIDNCNLSQTTFNVGSLLNISEKIKADVSFTYLKYNRLNSPVIGESYSNFNKGLLYSWPRSWKGIESTNFENEDGTMTEWDYYPFQYIQSNTFWNFYNNNTTLDRNKAYGSARLIYDVSDWLMVSGKVALDFGLDQFDTRNKATGIDGIQGAYYKTQMSKSYTIDGEFNITAYKNRIFGSKFNTKLSLGGESLYNNNYGLWAGTGTWANPGLYTIYNYSSTTSSQMPGESRYEKKVNSLYGFINIGYDDFLFIDITGRNDWSSTLPMNNNSYFYPSATLSFIPTEVFRINWGPVNFLKFRGSWAQTASDTDPYQLDFTYNSGSFGGYKSSSLPTVVPPLELKPQRQRAYEVGFNIGMWDNKLDVDFTYYDIYSWDQILTSPVAHSSGASSATINTGVVTNKGIEGIINYTVAQKNDWYLQLGLNFARNTNRILDLGGADMFLLAEIWGSNGPAIAVTEGEEYGTIYGWDYVYTYNTTDEFGNEVEHGPFYDENGNPIPLLNETGTTYAISDSRVPIGNSSPLITGGFNIRANWKNFSLYTLIDCKLGGDIYCASYVIAMQTGQSPETLYEREGNGLPLYDAEGKLLGNYGVVLPGFTGVDANGNPIMNENVVHYYYKYMPNYGGWGNYITTPGIVNNTWVKLREISLTYTFPRTLIEKQKVFQDVQISLVGRDLFYIYKSLPDNINPEGTMGAGNAQGLEYASYPGSRSFMCTLKVSF